MHRFPMNRASKLKAKVLSGKGFHNFAFADAVLLVESLGFIHLRTQGSHWIFSHPTIPEPINLQPVNGQCKPYQLRQIRSIIKEFTL